MASVTGTTEPTIQRIEHGHLNPRDNLRLAIAAALDADASDLWAYPSTDRLIERLHELFPGDVPQDSVR
jgi:DNA-binding XRE family transcriptional regulator